MADPNLPATEPTPATESDLPPIAPGHAEPEE